MPKLSGEKHETQFKEFSKFVSIKSNSKTIFFIGSSRVMMSINPDLLNDSLPEWSSINIGISGNSLAQNLYLANFLKNKPGFKVLFIELSRYKKNRLNNNVAQTLGLINYPDSYYEFIHDRPSVTSFLNNWEYIVWDWLYYIQNNIKQLISPNGIVMYQMIGFAPVYYFNFGKTDSFLSETDLLEFSNGTIDMEAMVRVHELLQGQVKGNYRVIFLLPVTTMEKSELKFSVPIFQNTPMNNKWCYDSSFIQAISHPKYLADKNHLNYQGSVIYTQGLLKYIKSNEASWQ
ncbi:hypothetical protein VR611_00940 [Aquirufa nivalisilvae]